MKRTLLGFGLSAVLATTAYALPAVTSHAGGSDFGIYYGASTGDVIGFGFTTGTDALIVSALGVLIDRVDGVLDSNHMVGIWDIGSGALMGSHDVDPSVGFDFEGFHYNDVTPFQLAAGTRYIAGAMYTATDSDSYSSGATVTTNWGISAPYGVYPAAGDLGFVMPTNTSTNNGRYGPNFIATPVPEPATMAILGLGAAALVRRRKK